MVRSVQTAILLAFLFAAGAMVSSMTAKSDEAEPARCWSRTYGVPERDGFHALKPTPGGGFVVAGGVAGPVSTDPSDVLVARMAADGSLLWARSYGGPLMDFSAGVWGTPDGGFIVGATTKSFAWQIDAYNVREPTFWLLKLDAEGDVEWERAYRIDVVGGELTSVQALVATDPLTGRARVDGYVVSGHGGGTEADGYVVRLDASGGMLWAKQIAQLAVQDPKKVVRGFYDEAWRVVQAKQAGGFLVAGWSMTEPHPDKDGWVLKLSDAGEVEWFNTYGSPTLQDKLIWIKEVPGHHGLPPTFVATGVSQDPLDFTQDAWVVALTPLGVPLWQSVLGRQWGGDEEAMHVHHVEQADGSHGLVLSGSTTAFGGHTNGLLAGLGMQGEPLWSRAYVGEHREILRAVEPTDAPGDFLAAGYTYSWGQGAGDGWVVRFTGKGEVAPLPGMGFASVDAGLVKAQGSTPIPEWQAASSEGIRVLDSEIRLDRTARDTGTFREGAPLLATQLQAWGC